MAKNPLLNLRQYATDYKWPRGLRVLLARPHAYVVARRLWEWPRRHALGHSVAPLFGRTYQRPVRTAPDAQPSAPGPTHTEHEE